MPATPNRRASRASERRSSRGCAPLQRQHRLRRQAQLVRHSHADAAVADVEAEIAGMARIPAMQAPIQLKAVPRSGEMPAARRFRPIQSKDRESRADFSRLSFQAGRVHSGRMARRRRKSGKKRVPARRASCWGCSAGCLLAAGAAAWLVLTPYGPRNETFVNMAPGSSATPLGASWRRRAWCAAGTPFDLVRWRRRGTLQAGEYRSTIRRR
jgi:hypothetical protein